MSTLLVVWAPRSDHDPAVAVLERVVVALGVVPAVVIRRDVVTSAGVDLGSNSIGKKSS